MGAEVFWQRRVIVVCTLLNEMLLQLVVHVRSYLYIHPLSACVILR